MSIRCPSARRLLAFTLALAACGNGTAPGASIAPDSEPADAAAHEGAGAAYVRGLPILDPSVHAHQASSHAPNGSNTTDFANSIRSDGQGRVVLMEAAGPGAITRVWSTPLTLLGESGDPAGIGQVRIFFDGETTPRVDMPATEFFSGKVAPFLSPVCGNYLVSSGGNYCNLRMPFRTGVKFTVTTTTQYYDIGYETFPEGTAVETFDPKSASTLAAARDVASLYAEAGSELALLPPGPQTTDTGPIPAGGRRVIAIIPHPGTVDAIEIEVDPHDDSSLRNLWLEARWDDEVFPAVAAPLADLFLSGAGERSPARGLLAGYSPEHHTGYLYFPMPFARSARLDLVNRGTATVTATWRIRQSALVYDGLGSSVGRFHATYAEDPVTALGQDYILLATGGAGKVVGLSFTESGPLSSAAALFMEGDERVYIDGSRTPDIYGTGTEDLFGGAYYYARGPFTLADHGATAKEDLPPEPGSLLGSGQTAQYRLMVADPWPFRDGIRFGLEHGAGDGMSTAAHSVVFWYGNDRPGMEPTDSIIVGDTESEQAAGYVAGAGRRVSLRAFFEGDRDGNTSSLVYDLANLGALPPLAGTDPLGEALVASGRSHPVGGVIRFAVSVDGDNRGVILRRQLDRATFGQRAEVLVDGTPAGIWLTPGANPSKRWAESDFAIPVGLTAGKARLDIELRVLQPEGARSGSPAGWTDFRYRAFSVGQR